MKQSLTSLKGDELEYRTTAAELLPALQEALAADTFTDITCPVDYSANANSLVNSPIWYDRRSSSSKMPRLDSRRSRTVGVARMANNVDFNEAKTRRRVLPPPTLEQDAMLLMLTCIDTGMCALKVNVDG